MTLQQQDRPQPPTRIDLYEVEVQIHHNNDAKVITKMQEYGEIKEERYTWGRDTKNRPRRERLVLSLVLPRDQVPHFKRRITYMNSKPNAPQIEYRKVSNLI